MSPRSLDEHLAEQERIRQPRPSGRAKRLVSGVVGTAQDHGRKPTEFVENLLKDKERALLRYIAELESTSTTDEP